MVFNTKHFLFVRCLTLPLDNHHTEGHYHTQQCQDCRTRTTATASRTAFPVGRFLIPVGKMASSIFTSSPSLVNRTAEFIGPCPCTFCMYEDWRATLAYIDRDKEDFLVCYDMHNVWIACKRDQTHMAANGLGNWRTEKEQSYQIFVEAACKR